jgi:LysR family cyn operon transcriptional activator
MVRYPLGMNLQQLRYLTALADAGSLTGAGRKLGVSEPVLSRALRSLEGELGVTLFAISGRRLVLTSQGTQVSDAARLALVAVEDVRSAALGLAQGTRLRVATTPTNGLVLSRLLEQAVRLWPEVALAVELADSHAGVVERVTERDCDLGFAEVGADVRGVRTHVVRAEEMVLVSPSGTHLPSSVTVTDLGGLPILMPPTSSRRRVLDEWFEAVGVRPELVLEADDRNAWLSGAQHGLGSFFSYRSLVPPVTPPVEVRSFVPHEWVELAFFHRDDRLSDPAAMLVELASSSEAW